MNVNENGLPVISHSTGKVDLFDPGYTDHRIQLKRIRYAYSKRLFDISFSIVLLLLAAPVFALVALGIKLTSRGPVLFKQVRVGRGGKHFVFYKFRSMCVDAEQMRQQLEHLNEADGPVFKIAHDPRITRFGAYIRKYSLDELPQFINIVKGDMSIVGPRPPLPCEVGLYSETHLQRLAIRPGLTCFWQIRGRNNIRFEQWMELDMEYIETMSFWQDLKIILLTIPAVLTGSGAH